MLNSLSLIRRKKAGCLKARNNFISIDDVVQPTPAPRFSKTNSESPKKAPKLGENNDEILTQLGYTDDEIKSFKERKIIQ